MMHDPEVIDALWAKIEPIAFITRDQFARGLDDWDVEVVHAGDEIAWVVMTQGPEIHFETFNLGLPITKSMIMERLEPLMEKHGFVTTRTPKLGTNRQHRFNKAFGFKVVGDDEFFVHYRKDASCQ